MATSEPSMEKNTGELSYLQPALLVSPRVEPGSKEARKTTAGFGLKLSECLERSSPLGRFSRILLASEMWGSPELFLKWEGSAITSECLLFRLVPSAPLIEESATGSWRTPQADNASQGPKKLETIQAQASPVITLTDQTKMIGSAWPTTQARDGGDRGSKTSAETQAKNSRPLNETLAAAWPTPDASEAGKTSRGGDRIDEPLIGGLLRKPWGTPKVGRGKYRKKDGEKMITLEGQIPGPWPTATAQDAELEGSAETQYLSPTLRGAAWATPNASVNSGGPCRPEGREGHAVELIDQPHHSASGMTPLGSLARTEKFAERLEILSCWLMGYPAAFLRLWPRKAGRTARSSPRSEMR